MAPVAPRLPPLENRPSLLQNLAHRRYLGASKRGTARALANITLGREASFLWNGPEGVSYRVDRGVHEPGHHEVPGPPPEEGEERSHRDL